jgi:hypothetical protein
MKKPNRQRGMLINLLPPQFREELKALEAARDDDSVSALEWHTRADKLLGRSATLPGPIREAFNRSIKNLAANERAEEIRTGHLVGLSPDADERAIREQEADLRRQINAGALEAEDAEALRRRLAEGL